MKRLSLAGWLQSTKPTNKTSEDTETENQSKTSQIGFKAESLCKEFLLSRGYKLIEVNYRCKLGEIDLIAQGENRLLFIEVRYRKNPYYGSGAASVTQSKQIKLLRAINFFLQASKKFSPIDSAYRIDVMEVSPTSASPAKDSSNEDQVYYFKFHKIRWIKNAILG